METRNTLTATRRGRGRGEEWKEGEETSQGTCKNDSSSWTARWGMTLGVGVDWAEEGKGGKIGTTLIG